MKLKKEVKIGIFAVVMILLLYWGINFIKGTDIFSRSTSYFAEYEQVNGLQTAAPVMIKGYKIGTVKSISFNPEHNEKIIVEMSLKSKYDVPENSRARVFSDGLMGGKAIEIQIGSSAELLQKGDTLRSESQPDLLEVAGSELEFLKKSINTVVMDLNSTLGKIDTILTDNALGLNRTINNLASVTGNLDNLIIAETKNIHQIIGNINQLSATLKNNTGNIDNVVKNINTASEGLAEANIGEIAGKVSLSLEALNGTLAKLNSDDGSLGKLLTDQSLYDSLVVATTDLSVLLKDVKENPKRYVSVSVFGGKNR